MLSVTEQQSNLDLKNNALSLSIVDIICQPIHLWASNYKKLLYRESHYSVFGDVGLVFVENDLGGVGYNKLTHLAYLCGKWNDFIINYSWNFLPFEAYSLMLEYNTLNNKRIVMLDHIYEIKLGEPPNLSLTDLFGFVDLDNNEQQSVYDIRQVMESTMFDIFDVYLRAAIEKSSRLKGSIEEVIHTNKCQFNFRTVDGGIFDFNSINFAYKQINDLDNLMLRLSNETVANPRQFIDLFNQQIAYIYNNAKANDIVHITFGTADIVDNLKRSNIQMFPLIINADGLYAWHNGANIFGSTESSYFGIHIDPMFADQEFFEKFLIKNNLYPLSNQFDTSIYKEYNIFTKPKLTKGSSFLFNQGSIDNVFRCYSKKFRNYGSGQQFIDFSLSMIENLLKKDLIVIVGSHLSSEDQGNNVVGPFFLDELDKLREQYNNFYVVFNKSSGLPYIVNSVAQEDIIYFFNNKPEQTSSSSIINDQTANEITDQPKDATVKNPSFSCVLA